MTVCFSRSTLLHGAVQYNLWIGREKLMTETFFEFNSILPFLMNILCNLKPTLFDVRLLGTREITYRIVMAKAAFNKKKVHSTNKLDLNLRKKQVKFCILSIDWYAAKNWTLESRSELPGKFLCCWRRREIRVEVIQRVKEDRNVLQTVKKKKG